MLDSNAISEKSFDVITLLGVLSIFDDVEPALTNLIRWTKPNGKLFIHGMFNPENIDVFLKYRSSDDYGDQIFESGWNIISQNTIKNILNKNGITSFVFHKFDISIDIPKNVGDSVRSWTEQMDNGKRIITNGLCLIQPHYLLEINI